jgi:hypothetical protein
MEIALYWSMDVARFLRRQHRELRAMLDEVRRSTEQRRLVAFEMLNDAVTHHWIAEERHLYPFLDRLDYRELYASIEQHRALCHIMADLRGLCDDGPHFHSALKVLGAHVEQHILDEEHTLLPFLAEHAERCARQGLAEEMAATVAELENADWLGAPQADGGLDAR